MNITRCFLCAAALCLMLSVQAQAQEQIQDILIQSGESVSIEKINTFPIMRLTPDKSELINLSTDAASIMVGNPAHLSVLAESSKTLVVIPKEPGASHFTVLDDRGEVILQRHVIVAAPQKNYLRIRRSCSNGDENCQATSMYYCPDMCHEISVTENGQQSAGAGNTAAGGEVSANSGSALTAPEADGEQE